MEHLRMFGLKFILTLIFVFGIFSIFTTEGKSVILPPNGFRFPCGTDICIFPDQYCDVEDKRCSYCSVYICSLEKIPQDCQYQCAAISSNSLEASTLPDSLSQTIVNQQNSESQLFWLAIIGICLISLILLLLLMREGRRCLKNKRQKEEQYGLVPVYNQDRCRIQGTIPDTKDQTTNTESLLVAQPDEASVLRADNLGDHRILPTHNQK